MNLSRTVMNLLGPAARRYAIVLLLAALCGAGAAIPFATSSASAQASPNALVKRLETAVTHVSAVIARHHTPSGKALNDIATLAHKLQRTGTQAPRCQAALAAAERLPAARHHRHRLAHDVAAATRGLPACAKSVGDQTTSTSTRSSTSTTTTTTTTSAPSYVGGTVVNASGQPAVGVTVLIDVEFKVGYSGEGESATTDSAGHFEFPDLSAAAVQPSWKFLDATATFVWNGASVIVGMDGVDLTNPADQQWKLDGSGSLADTIIFNMASPDCGDDALYPISVTLTPLALADGAPLTPRTLSLAEKDICGNYGYGYDVPVDLGAWQVTGGATNDGQTAKFSTDGGQTFYPSANLFDQLTSGTPPQWPTRAGVVLG